MFILKRKSYQLYRFQLKWSVVGVLYIMLTSKQTWREEFIETKIKWKEREQN